MNERIDPPGAESAGGRPEDAGLSVDAKFARLAAEIDGSQVQGKGAKEEAARTRRLRAEWSKTPPKATPWRSDGPSTMGSLPAYPLPDQPRRKRRGSGSARVVSVLVVAVLGLVMYAGGKHGQATQISINTPETYPSPSQSFANPDDNYFVGSPALDWSNNEAGFSIPAATALNGVSESDIAAGYKELEELMVAGNLNTTVLDGGSVYDFTKLLDPKSDMGSNLQTWIAHPSAKNDPVELVTRFEPANTRLLGQTVKVRGSMTAKADTQSHSVLLTADYIFVYAVGPASGASDEDTRVVMHRTVQIQAVDPAYFQSTAGKIWITQYSYSVGNSDCYNYNGFVDPAFGGDGGAPNDAGTVDPYATGNLLTASPDSTATGQVCQAVSGL
jgi:hypothetical protein